MKPIVDASSPYGKGFYDEQKGGSLSSAEVTIPVVTNLIGVRSAVDVGCGVGTWLSVLAAHGVSDVIGVDGDYVDRQALQIPSGKFLPMDIREPFVLGRRFDLALSLEVGEHLPAESAKGFVDSLARLAPVVLFSAAIPFQGGTHHINEQWPEYWADLFRCRGFSPIDCIRSHIWNDPRVDWWYAQNILVFANDEGIKKNTALADSIKYAPPLRLSVVHPKWYLKLANPPVPGFKTSISLTATSAKNAVLKRLRKRPTPQKGNLGQEFNPLPKPNRSSREKA